MYKPSSSPQSVSAQREQLERERASINAWAQEIVQTKNMHMDNLVQYTKRLSRLTSASGRPYDLDSDPNYEYYLRMIELCEQRLDALRVKYARITDLIAQ